MAKPKAKVVRNSAQFGDVSAALLQSGMKVRFRANGLSMRPNVLDNDSVIVAPTHQKELRRGDVALTHGPDGFRVHRVAIAPSSGALITRADAGQENDAATHLVLGRVTAVVRNGRKISFQRPWMPQVHAARNLIHMLRLVARRRMTLRFLAAAPALILLQLFVAATPVKAVAVTLTQT
ncbi:MAG: S24/S26 family peptidase, partial [Candidatus Acidiferrum sp.]